MSANIQKEYGIQRVEGIEGLEQGLSELKGRLAESVELANKAEGQLAEARKTIEVAKKPAKVTDRMVKGAVEKGFQTAGLARKATTVEVQRIIADARAVEDRRPTLKDITRAATQVAKDEVSAKVEEARPAAEAKRKEAPEVTPQREARSKLLAAHRWSAGMQSGMQAVTKKTEELKKAFDDNMNKLSIADEAAITLMQRLLRETSGANTRTHEARRKTVEELKEAIGLATKHGFRFSSSEAERMGRIDKELAQIEQELGKSESLVDNISEQFEEIVSFARQTTARDQIENIIDEVFSDPEIRGQYEEYLGDKEQYATYRNKIANSIINSMLSGKVLGSAEKMKQVVKILMGLVTYNVAGLTAYDVKVYFVGQSQIDHLAGVYGLTDAGRGLSMKVKDNATDKEHDVILISREARDNLHLLRHEVIEVLAKPAGGIAAEGGVSGIADSTIEEVHKMAKDSQETELDWVPVGEINKAETPSDIAAGVENGTLEVIAVEGRLALKAAERKAHPAHAPPIKETKVEEFLASGNLDPLKAHLSATADSTERANIIRIVVSLAGKKEKDAAVRQNARRLLSTVLEVPIRDIEKSFSVRQKREILARYLYHMSNRENMEIFDAVINSALAEDNTTDVYKNFTWLSGTVDKWLKVHDSGLVVLSELENVNKLINRIAVMTENLQTDSDLFGLEVMIGNLITRVSAEKQESVNEDLDKLINELKSIGAAMPTELHDFLSRLEKTKEEISDVFGKAYQHINQYRQQLAKLDTTAPVVDDVGQKLKAEKEETTHEFIDALIKSSTPKSIRERLSGFFRVLRRFKSVRKQVVEAIDKQQNEVVEGLMQDIEVVGVLERINKDRSARGEEEIDFRKDFRLASYETVKRFFELGNDKKARDVLERILSLHTVYQKDISYLNDEEIRWWATLVKMLTNAWGESTEKRAEKEIDKFLDNIGERKEELLNKITEMEAMFDRQLSELNAEREKIEAEIEKIDNMLKTGLSGDGERLSHKNKATLEDRMGTLSEGLGRLQNEITNLNRLKGRIAFSKQVISEDAIDEDVKIGLRENLMTIFVKSEVHQRIRQLKDKISSMVQKELEKSELDKYGNYTQKAMREAYEKITLNQKLIAASCVDLTMKHLGGYSEGLYGVQLLAGLLSAEGFIVNLKTGEGKTEFSTVALTIASLTGLKAFAETSNPNLARKDYLVRKKIFDFMGIRSALFDPGELRGLDAKKRHERVKQLFDENTDEVDTGVDIVTYDTAGFKFEVADDLVKLGDEKLIKKGRKFMFGIIDEIDASTRELSTQYRIALESPELKESTPQYRLVEESVRLADLIVKRNKGRIVKMARETGRDLTEEAVEKDYYYTVNSAKGEVSIVNEEAIREECGAVGRSLGISAREVYDWVKKSIEMIETYRMDVEYSLAPSGEVKLYDTSGLLGNRRLSDGRHTILEMYLRTIKGYKDVVVYGDSVSKSEIGGGVAVTEYFSVVTGSSGTATSSAWELKHVIGNQRGVAGIPTNIKRIIHEMKKLLVDGKADLREMVRKWVADGMDTVSETLSPSFLHVRTSGDARDIRDVLRTNFPDIKVQIVDILQKAVLDEVIKESGKRNVVTIFTVAGARGTDYQAFFKNIRTLDDVGVAGEFSRLLNILGEDAETAKLRTAIKKFRTTQAAGDVEGQDAAEKDIHKFMKDIAQKSGFEINSSDYRKLMTVLFNLMRILKMDSLEQSDEKVTEAIEGELGAIKVVTMEKVRELRQILLDADKDENREGESRKAIEKRITSFFHRVEAELNETRDKKTKEKFEKQMKNLTEFRADVEVRYLRGFRLLAQISDKTLGDQLQALGRIGRQADPANITLFFDISDISDKSDDFNILTRGLMKSTRRLGKAIGDIKAYRKLTNRVRSNIPLSDREEEQRDKLRRDIYGHIFAALLQHDLKGQKERESNHRKDLAVYRQFVDKMAEFRAKIIGGNVAELEEGKIATAWIDEIVKQFETADAEKAKKLRVLLAMAFGEKDDLMATLFIVRKDRGKISLWDLNKNNVRVFAEVLKALIKDQPFRALNQDVKDVIDGAHFERLRSVYNSNTLITKRFKDLYNETVTELLQYQFFQKVAELRRLKPRDFASTLSTWCDNRISNMARLMTQSMLSIGFEGINKDTEKPLSQYDRDKEAGKKVKAYGDVVKSGLKRILRKGKSTLIGRLTVRSISGAGIGAILGSLIPIVGTIVGSIAGGVIGLVTTFVPGRFGWSDLVKERGVLSASLIAGGTIIKESVKGLSLGAVIGGILGGVICGIGGALLGGVSAIPAAIAGAKYGALIGASAGFVSKTIQATDRVFAPRAVPVAVEKVREGLESIADEQRALEKHEEPLAYRREYVQEVRDERGLLFKKMLGKDEKGETSIVIKRLLEGESVPEEMAEPNSELDERIGEPSAIDINGRRTFIFEVQQRVGKDGKVLGDGTLTPEERMEVLGRYLERVEAERLDASSRGAAPPESPDFICIRAGAFNIDSEDGKERADQIISEFMSQNESIREEGQSLCLFADRLTKESEITGATVLTYSQALALSENFETSGVAIDIGMPDGENAEFRVYNGRIFLLIRCDKGPVIVRDMGTSMDTRATRLAQTILALGTFKAKGWDAILEYDSPKSRSERKKREKEIASIKAMMGSDVGDSDMEIALNNPVVKDLLLDNSNLDADDIEITPDGIYIKKPLLPSDKRKVLISFAEGGLELAEDVAVEFPAIPVVVLPLSGWRSRVLTKLMEFSNSRLIGLKEFFKALFNIEQLDEKLKSYPKISRAVNKILVDMPSQILSLNIITQFVYMATDGIPELINTKAATWISEKVRDIKAKFAKRPTPNMDKLIELYSPPAAEAEMESLCREWTGTDVIDQELLSAIKQLSHNRHDKGSYFNLAEMLYKLAKNRETNEGKKAAEKLYIQAAKFYEIASFFDNKNAAYRMALARVLVKLGKGDRALEHASFALKKGKFGAAETDELRLIKGRMLLEKKKYGEASRNLKKLATSEALEEAEDIKKQIYGEWGKQEQEKKKAATEEKKKGMGKAFLESIKEKYASKKAIITIPILIGVAYAVPAVIGALGVAGAWAIALKFGGISLVTMLANYAMEKFTQLIKGEKKHSLTRSKKLETKAKKAFVKVNPEDIKGRVRLVNHYIAEGNTKAALKHIQRAIALFSRHRLVFWRRKYTSARNLALLGYAVLDIEFTGEHKDRVRKDSIPKILREIRGQDSQSPYVYVLSAKFALKEGDSEVALRTWEKMGMLDMTQEADRDIVILKLEILKDMLEKEVEKPDRNKKTIAEITQKIDDIKNERHYGLDNFNDRQRQELYAYLGDAAKALKTLEDKREKDAKETLETAKAGTPEKPLAEAKAEVEEEPKVDEIKDLEGILNRDPFNFDAALKLSGLYLQDGKNEKAEEKLRHILKESKDREQIDRAAERLALVRILQNKRPGRLLLRKIRDTRIKHILTQIQVLKKKKKIDSGKLLQQLLPDEPEQPITILDGILLSSAVSSLAIEFNVSNRREFRNLRKEILTQLEAFEKRVEGRTFVHEATGDKIRELLSPENLSKLSEKVAEDAKTRGTFKKISNRIDTLLHNISALTERLRHADYGLMQAPSSERRRKRRDGLEGRIAEKQEDKMAKTKEAIEVILKEKDPLVLAKLMEELTELQKDYVRDALGDSEAVRNSWIEVIMQLSGLIETYGDNKTLKEAAMAKLEEFARELDSMEREGALDEPEGSAEYRSWKMLATLLEIMKKLETSGRDWDIVSRLALLSSYIDVMLGRNDDDRPPAFTFQYIQNLILAGFESIDDESIKDVAVERIIGILKKDISRGEGDRKESFVDDFINAITGKDVLLPILNKIAEAGLSQRVFIRRADEWLVEIQGISDADKRDTAIKNFVEWLNRIEDSKIASDIVKTIEGITDAGIKARILSRVASAKAVVITRKIELLIWTLLNSRDNKDVYNDALSGLKSTLEKEKISTRVVDSVLNMADSILTKPDLSDSEIVEIFNLLLAVKDRKVRGRIKKVKQKAEEVYNKIVELREDSLKQKREAIYRSMMAIIDVRVRLAEAYETAGEFEKARKELEEVNEMLNGEIKKAIELQHEEKLSEYGGEPREVITKDSEILDRLEQVLRKQDKLDSDWYISRAHGEILLARFYEAQGELDTAEIHIKGADKHIGAFGYLFKAQKLDPTNAKLPLAFDVARFEMSRLELTRKSKKDYVSLLKKREETQKEKDRVQAEVEGIRTTIKKLEDEVAALEISDTRTRLQKLLEEAGDGVELQGKRKRDIVRYEEETGIAQKKTEISSKKKDKTRLNKELREIRGKLKAFNDEIIDIDNAFAEQGPLALEIESLILNAIDIIQDGDSKEEDVSNARAFIENLSNINVLQRLFATIDRKKESIATEIDREKREKQFAVLRDIEFSVIHKVVARNSIINAIVKSTENTVRIKKRKINTIEFFEFIMEKIKDDKAELIDTLAYIAREAVDQMVGAVAEEYMLDVIFELADLKGDPEQFDDKSTDEIKNILYKKLNAGLATTDKEYQTADSLLAIITPLVEKTIAALKDVDRRWLDMDRFERRLLLAGENDLLRLRFARFEQEKYGVKGFVELAKKELANGNLFDALDILDEALAISSDSLEANFYKAKVLRELGSLHDAVKFLKKALEKDAENTEVLETLLAVYSQLYDDLNRADINLKLYDLHMKKAKEDKEKGRSPTANYKIAQEYAEDAVLADPRQAKAKEKLSKVLLKQDKHEEAERIVNDVIQASGGFLLLSKAWRNWFKREEKKRLREYGPVATQEDASALIEILATIYLEAETVESAQQVIDLIKEHKKLMKDSPLAYSLSGRAYRILGRKRVARRALNKAAILDAKEIEAQEELVKAYEGIGDFGALTKAIELAGKGSESDKGRKKFWDKRIAGLHIERSGLSRNRWERGRRLLKRQMEDLTNALGLAKDFEEKDKKDIAESIDKRRKQIDAELAELKIRSIRKQMRDKVFGEIAELKFEAAKIKVGIGEITESIEGMDEVLDLIYGLRENEKSPSGLVEEGDKVLSKIYGLKGDLAEKKPDKLGFYKKAITLDTANYKAHYGIAQIYEDMDDLDLAASHFEEAKKDKELEGDDLTITQKIIELYEKTGNPKAAELARELRKTRMDTRDKAEELSKAARNTESIWNLVSQYLTIEKITDNLKARLDQIKEANEAVSPDVVDTEVRLVKEFIELDKQEISALEADSASLLKQVLKMINERPKLQMRTLIKQLVEKLEDLDAEKAILRLERLLSFMDTTIVGREHVLLSLAKFYIDKKENKKALEKLTELSLIGGIHYNVRIETALLLYKAYKGEQDYERAAENLIAAALDIYESEAFGGHRDNRLSGRVVEELSNLLELAKEGKVDLGKHLYKVIKTLIILEKLTFVNDLIGILSLQAQEKIIDVARLLGERDISRENKQAIIKALLEHFKLGTAVINTIVIAGIIPLIRTYRRTDSSGEVLSLLGHLYAAAGMRIRRFIAARQAGRKGEAIERNSRYYYNRAIKRINNRKYKKGLEDLEKSAAINKGLLESDDFKKARFDARMGMTEKARYRGRRHKRLKDKISALNEALQLAYTEELKERVRERLLAVHKELMGIYERQIGKRWKIYRTLNELNEARNTTLLEMAQIYLAAQQTELAEATYNAVLDVMHNNKAAQSGLEKVALHRRAMEKNGNKPLTDENKNRFYTKVYAEMAQETEDVTKKKEYLKGAISLTPEGTEAYVYLADVLKNEGNFEGAKENLNKVMELAEEKGDAALKQRIEGIVSELEMIDNVIDRVLDRDSAVLIAETAKLEKGKREARVRELRQEFSQGTKRYVKSIMDLKKFYRSSLGSKESISPEKIQENVETGFREVDGRVGISDINKVVPSKGHAMARMIERGKKLLSEMRLEALEELLYVASEAGVRNDDLELLTAKRLIAAAKGELVAERVNWQDISAREKVIAAQIDLIEDNELKVKGLLEFGSYYTVKADLLSGSAKDGARRNAEKFYVGVLKLEPFSLDAVKALTPLKDAEDKVLDALQNILNNQDLQNKDSVYKSNLMSLLSYYWKKTKGKIIFDENTIRNFGDISIELGIQVANFLSNNNLFNLLPAIFVGRDMSKGEQMAIFETLSISLSHLRFNQLEIFSTISADLDGMLAKVSEDEDFASRIVQSYLLIARAYANIGEHLFREAEKDLTAAKNSNNYTGSQVTLARIKMKIAQGRKLIFWSLATRKLSAEDRRTADINKAESYKAKYKKKDKQQREPTDKQAINSLKRALQYNPYDTDTHKRLNELYEKTGKYKPALFEAIAVMSIFVERERYQDGLDYYAQLGLSRVEYQEYTKELSMLASLRNKAQVRLVRKRKEKKIPAGQIAYGDAQELKEALSAQPLTSLRPSINTGQIIQGIKERVDESALSADTKEAIKQRVDEFVVANVEFKEFSSVVLKDAEDTRKVTGWLLGLNTMPRAPDAEMDEPQNALQRLLYAEHPNIIALSSDILDNIELNSTLLHEYIFHEVICPSFGHLETRKMQEEMFAENYAGIVGDMHPGHRDGRLTYVLKSAIGGVRLLSDDQVDRADKAFEAHKQKMLRELNKKVVEKKDFVETMEFIQSPDIAVGTMVGFTGEITVGQLRTMADLRFEVALLRVTGENMWVAIKGEKDTYDMDQAGPLWIFDMHIHNHPEQDNPIPSRGDLGFDFKRNIGTTKTITVGKNGITSFDTQNIRCEDHSPENIGLALIDVDWAIRQELIEKGLRRKDLDTLGVPYGIENPKIREIVEKYWNDIGVRSEFTSWDKVSNRIFSQAKTSYARQLRSPNPYLRNKSARIVGRVFGYDFAKFMDICRAFAEDTDNARYTTDPKEKEAGESIQYAVAYSYLFDADDALIGDAVEAFSNSKYGSVRNLVASLKPKVPLAAEKPAVAPREVTRIMIGVVGRAIDESEFREYLESVRSEYPDVLFVRLSESGENAKEELEAILGDAMVRVVVDLGDLKDVMANMDMIVNTAKIQSFVLTYPYMVALNENNITRLTRDSLVEVFDIIQAALPGAVSLDLDYILSRDLTSRIEPLLPVEPVRIDETVILNTIGTITPQVPQGYIASGIEPTETGEWIDAYLSVLNEYRQADASQKKELAQKVQSFQYDLLRFLNGRDVSEIRDLLTRHEAIAIARYSQSRGASSFMRGVLDEIEGRLADNEICVAVFEEELLKDEALSDVKKLVAETERKKANVRVVVVGSGEKPDVKIPGAIYMQQKPEMALASQVMEDFAKAANIPEVKITTISIAMTREATEELSDVKEGLTKYKDIAPSFVLVEKLTKAKEAVNIGQLNIASLLRAISIRKPCFLALGEFDESVMKDIKDLIMQLGGFFKMMTDVAEAISEIFYSIKAVSVSL